MKKSINTKIENVSIQNIVEATINSMSDANRQKFANVSCDAPDPTEIGKVMLAYNPAMIEFCNTLFGAITTQRVVNKHYSNRYKEFKKGTLELGDVMQIIYNGLIMPKRFNGDANVTLWNKERTNPQCAFIKRNYEEFYKLTIDRKDFAKAFTSWGNLEEFVAKKVDTIYTSAEYDEQLMFKYLVLKVFNTGYIYEKELDSDTNTALLEEIRNMADYFSFMSDKYNTFHVDNFTDGAPLFMIDVARKNKIDVNTLANVFHLEKAEMHERMVAVDRWGFSDAELKRLNKLINDDEDTAVFTSAELAKFDKIRGFMFDPDWFEIYDNLYETYSLVDPEGLNQNMWLHVWQSWNYNPFVNAVAFVSEAEHELTLSANTVAVGATVAVTAKNGYVTISDTTKATYNEATGLITGISAGTCVVSDGITEITLTVS